MLSLLLVPLLLALVVALLYIAAQHNMGDGDG